MKPKTFKDYYSLLLAGKGNKRKAKTIAIPEIISEAVVMRELLKKDKISPITLSSFKISPEQTLAGTRLKSQKQNTLKFSVPGQDRKKYEVVFKCEEIPKTKTKLLGTICKVDCNCGAFRNQGMQYKLSTVDGAIKPETIPDEVWGPRHGNRNYVCKHIYAVLTKIKNSKYKTTPSLFKWMKK